MDLIKELRPVEALYLMAESEKKKVNEIDAIFSILVYLVNNEYAQIIDNELKVSYKTNVNDAKLRIYEKNILNSIAIQEKSKIYYAIKNFDFKEFLYKRNFYTKEIEKKGIWILKFNKTKYTPTGKYHEALNYLNSLKMKVAETQKVSKKYISVENMHDIDKNSTLDKITPKLQDLKSYAFSFSEFILNFKEISTMFGIFDIASICRSYADLSYQSVMSASKCDACKACKSGKKLH